MKTYTASKLNEWNQCHEVTGICYKWLDYKSLCFSFLRPNQELNQIYFFTAVTDYF